MRFPTVVRRGCGPERNKENLLEAARCRPVSCAEGLWGGGQFLRVRAGRNKENLLEAARCRPVSFAEGLLGGGSSLFRWAPLCTEVGKREIRSFQALSSPGHRFVGFVTL